jgi:hypothetical protein
MASSSTISQLHIRNTSGSQIFCGFIPPHGVTLTAGQVYVTPAASLRDLCVRGGRFQYVLWNSLIANLDAGNFVISELPKVILYDATNYAVKTLTLAGGSLTVTDPTWGATGGPD